MRVLKILHDIQCLRYIKSTTITVMAYSKQSYSLLRHHCIDHILSNFVIFYFFFEEQVNQDVDMGRIEASGQTHFKKRNIGNILNLDWLCKLNNYPFKCAAKPFSRFIITLSSALPLNLFEIKKIVFARNF